MEDLCRFDEDDEKSSLWEWFAGRKVYSLGLMSRV